MLATFTGMIDRLAGRALGRPAPTIGPAATGQQARKGGGGTFLSGGDPIKAPPPGTYATYREMRKDPTIEIARAAATIPIKAAGWAYEAGEGGTDAMVEFVRKTIEPLRARLLHDAMYALDYGWQSWEIVWSVNGQGRIVPRLKPLMPDVTEIETDKKTGALVGVSQAAPPAENGQAQSERVLLRIEDRKVMLWSYDREGDNWHGRSRMENVRCNAWDPWVRISKRLDKYTERAAGNVMVCTYPQGGEWKDQYGNTVTSDQAAANLLATVAQNGSVAIPRIYDAAHEMLLQNTTNPEALLAWKIDLLQTAAGHSAEMVELLRYYDALKMRGWLVPERSATEGTHGTLAEAEEHGDLAISIAAATRDDLLECVNAQLIGPLLVLNFGEQARQAVRVTAAAGDVADLAFLRDLAKAVLTNPNNMDLAMGVMDIDALMDQLGVPKLKGVVDASDVDPQATPLSRAILRHGAVMARLARRRVA